MTNDSWMVIGYGNSLRRDDGAGLLLATRLAAELAAAGQRVDCCLYQQLTIDLAAEIDELAPTRVLFVDAAVDRPLTGGVGLVSVGPAADAAHAVHHSSPALVLTALDRLYERRPQAWLFTVPVADLAHGCGLSAPVQALLDSPSLAAALLDRLP